jgi:hypothetical protein
MSVVPVGKQRAVAPKMATGPYNAADAPGAFYPAAAVASSDDRKYVTIKNLAGVPRRLKPLPPDANAGATPCKLYQLRSHVEFRCYKCRRDGIFDDSIAADETSGLLMCSACYSRAVRPRVYKPTRVIPFPSLLSWLNYKPATVVSEVSTDMMNRPAEAAMPSGHRVNVEAITATGVEDLPSTPMNPLGGRLDDVTRGQVDGKSDEAKAAAAGLPTGSHPCPSVFGGCDHGALCFFLKAPAALCVAHLMGLCVDNAACEREHTAAYDLPSAAAAPAREEADGCAAFAAWAAGRKASSNQAEWQLWNQPGAAALVDRKVPVIAVPVTAVEPQAAPAKGLDMSALKNVLSGLKK